MLNGKGNPFNRHNLYNREYLPAIGKAGILRLRFHTLRYTFASILIDQGGNIKYIQSQLGHAKASTTLDIYRHLMKPENPSAAMKRGNLIFGDLEAKWRQRGEKELIKLEKSNNFNMCAHSSADRATDYESVGRVFESP